MDRQPETSTSSISAIAFDFGERRDQVIPLAEVLAACERGLRCWIDLGTTDRRLAEAALRELEVDANVIEEAVARPLLGRHDVHEDCLHVSLAVAEVRHGRIEHSSLDLIVSERFVITLHAGPIGCVERTARDYHLSFQKFAKSLGFLLFEISDHLIDSYRAVFEAVEVDVEHLQASIFGDVDDTIFTRVARLTDDLLVLRKHVLANREVLHQMATRKSSFVPETTQPYLSNMVGTLERLGTDLAVEREILAETLTLYLGIVGHRTNQLLHRLTLVSVVFLPLTFLCGVYGMNFDVIPELHWRYGYGFFWGAVLVIVAGTVLLMRAKRWW